VPAAGRLVIPSLGQSAAVAAGLHQGGVGGGGGGVTLYRAARHGGGAVGPQASVGVTFHTVGVARLLDRGSQMPVIRQAGNDPRRLRSLCEHAGLPSFTPGQNSSCHLHNL